MVCLEILSFPSFRLYPHILYLRSIHSEITKTTRKPSSWPQNSYCKAFSEIKRESSHVLVICHTVRCGFCEQQFGQVHSLLFHPPTRATENHATSCILHNSEPLGSKLKDDRGPLKSKHFGALPVQNVQQLAMSLM